MQNEKLENKKRRLQTLRENRQELLDIKESLLKDPAVKRYLEVDGLIEKSSKEIEEQYLEIQKACQHPGWYFVKSYNNIYDGKLYWSCKCLECGKTMVGEPEYFLSGLVIKEENSVSYSDAALAFNQLKEEIICEGENTEEKIVSKILSYGKKSN